MSTFEKPRVAILGAGTIGCGWAALTVGAGWQVAIYDADTAALQSAPAEIATRVASLVKLERAEDLVAEDSLKRLRIGRSLLNAVQEADWIIEAVARDLGTKQRLLEQVEPIARRAAIITSSAGDYSPSDLVARLVRADRVMVAHPTVPVEYLPVVELVPGPQTDPACVEDVRFWLGMLGRAPIVLKREIHGNVVDRIQASIWREWVRLVLEGVLDVEDADIAVSHGTCLAWAAAGPAMAAWIRMAGRNPDIYLPTLFKNLEEVWTRVAPSERMEPEDQKRLIRLIEKAYNGLSGEAREARDRRLSRLLSAAQE